MKSYLIVYNKKGGSSIEELENRLKFLFEKYYQEIPLISSKQINNYICMNFSNEGYVLRNRIPYSFIGYSGYINEDGLIETTEQLNNEKDIIKLLLKRNKDEYFRKMSGVFSFALVRGNTAEVWNNITGVEPVYFMETDKHIIIGNKLLLVHLICAAKDDPEYAVENMASFLNNGYYADGLLPYRNVHRLPNGFKISIHDGKLAVNQYTLSNNDYYQKQATEETYDDITNIFMETFKGLPKQGTLNLSLSGRKDSRLIIAALTQQNINFKTYTDGIELSPDVVIAKQVSDLLGIEHKTIQPVEDDKDYLNVNLSDRINNTIRLYEGLLYGYENTPLYTAFSPENIIIGGQGGDLLRGGFPSGVRIEDQSQLTSRIEGMFFNYNQYLNEDYASQYKQKIINYALDHLEHMNYQDLMNKMHLDLKTGRWSAASKPAYSFYYPLYSPFFDNKLINKVSELDTSYGANDTLIFNLLQRLNPQLIGVPFANERWNFEKDHPRRAADLDNWIQRKPYVSKNQRANFNWRRNLFANFKDELYDIIFQRSSSDIFNLVDKVKTKKLFDESNSTRFDYYLWSLATLSLLISNDWIKNKSSEMITKVMLPKQVDRKQLILDEIKKIDSTNLSSMNEQVKIYYKDSLTARITWSDFDPKESNLYIQLYDNSFTESPSEQYHEISKVEGFSKIRYAFEYDTNVTDSIIIDIFVMTYDSNKRLNNYRFQKKLVERSDFIDVTVNLKESEKYYKVAIKLSEAPNQGHFNINQMRMEYYK